MPPIEMPMTWAASSPTASISAVVSLAMSPMVKSAATGELRPMPRLSNITSSKSRSRRPANGSSQCALFPLMPMMSRSGSPEPRRS
jgi:hypothetical protein